VLYVETILIVNITRSIETIIAMMATLLNTSRYAKSDFSKENLEQEIEEFE